jgi:hypothetical protein
MTISHRTSGTLAAALATFLLVQPSAKAADADTQEVMAYTLTDAGLAKYTKATKNLAALPGGPGACASDDDDSDSGSKSISELVAKIDAAPGAKAAIQSAGLTSREYIVFSLSLLQNGLAAWGLKAGGKLPPGVKQANVDFVNSHGAQLEQLKGTEKSCDEDEPAEEEPSG